MNVCKRINKNEIIVFAICILLVDLLIYNGLESKVDLNIPSYEIGVIYLYYRIIRANTFFLLVIPVFLYFNRYVYKFLYEHKVIIKYENLKVWWKDVTKNTVILVIYYTLIRNAIVFLISIFEHGIKIEFGIKTCIYLIIALGLQCLFLMCSGMIMNIILFLIRREYVAIFTVAVCIISYDFIMSSLRIISLKLEVFIFFYIKDDVSDIMNKLFVLGVFLVISLVIYEIGERIVERFNIYRSIEVKNVR